MENGPLLEDLEFAKSSAKLHYYCCNWRVAGQLAPSDVGLVLL